MVVVAVRAGAAEFDELCFFGCNLWSIYLFIFSLGLIIITPFLQQATLWSQDGASVISSPASFPADSLSGGKADFHK